MINNVAAIWVAVSKSAGDAPLNSSVALWGAIIGCYALVVSMTTVLYTFFSRKVDDLVISSRSDFADLNASTRIQRERLSDKLDVIEERMTLKIDALIAQVGRIEGRRDGGS
jgi:hypothetical protein